MDKTINLIRQKGTTLLEALVATAIIGIGFIAIFESEIHTILYSYPFSKINYLSAKFLSGFFIVNLIILIIFLGTPLGLILPGTNQEIVNPFDLKSYLDVYYIVILPNLFLYSLRCINSADSKSLKTYSICRDTAVCTNQNNAIYDKLYFGKVEISIGTKSKNLYFRIH